MNEKTVNMLFLKCIYLDIFLAFFNWFLFLLFPCSKFPLLPTFLKNKKVGASNVTKEYRPQHWMPSKWNKCKKGNNFTVFESGFHFDDFQKFDTDTLPSVENYIPSDFRLTFLNFVLFDEFSWKHSETRE